jgi:hypothetical protein
MGPLQGSWATGTDPEVNSIYQRLLADRPEMDGKLSNQAKGGAAAAALASQAEAALRIVPSPAIAIIQTIDNDIRCDGTDEAHVAEFGQAVKAALDVITAASPQTRILVLSQRGRPANDPMALSDDPAVTAQLRGMGMCDFFDLDGVYMPDRVATLTEIIEAYEAEQARVCAEVPQCHDDGGALAADVPDLSSISGDGAHGNAKGHARVAELVWPLVADMLGIPAGVAAAGDVAALRADQA